MPPRAVSLDSHLERSRSGRGDKKLFGGDEGMEKMLKSELVRINGELAQLVRRRAEVALVAFGKDKGKGKGKDEGKDSKGKDEDKDKDNDKGNGKDESNDKDQDESEGIPNPAQINFASMTRFGGGLDPVIPGYVYDDWFASVFLMFEANIRLL